MIVCVSPVLKRLCYHARGAWQRDTLLSYAPTWIQSLKMCRHWTDFRFMWTNLLRSAFPVRRTEEQTWTRRSVDSWTILVLRSERSGGNEEGRRTLESRLTHINRTKNTEEEKRWLPSTPEGQDGFIKMVLWMFTGIYFAFSGQSRRRR